LTFEPLLSKLPATEIMINRSTLAQRGFGMLLSVLFLSGCNKAPQTTDEHRTASNSNTPAAATTGDQDKQWTTTASGLKYQVLKHGTGTVSPKPTDTVNVHYHGTLLNGTVFDSSVERGQPLSFPLNAVIPGWTEGLQLMKVGDKFKFEIPPNLAYGPASPSEKIPPNSTLVFEVELLAIQ
jgi:FKBP-type peptidyl-prolyl cis-trans isomerase